MSTVQKLTDSNPEVRLRELVDAQDWTQAADLLTSLPENWPVTQSFAALVYKAFTQEKDERRAEEWLDRLLALSPRTATYQRNKGAMHQRRNEWPAALACYRAAADLRPDVPVYHGAVATALFHTGDYAAAAKAFEMALEGDAT
jgi:tetratricopeptide (TPR) repeat protein